MSDSDSISAALRTAQWAQRKQIARRRRQLAAQRQLTAAALPRAAACTPAAVVLPAARRAGGDLPWHGHDPNETAVTGRSPRQRTGDRYEALALEVLRAAGLALLARKLACRAGEIDLVMRDRDQLVFIEVRARADGDFGGAAASIGPAKQARLQRAAHYWLPWLARGHWNGAVPACRFDVVAFEAGRSVWIRQAFDAR